MVRKLKNRDFHINLWEHAFVDCSSPIYNEIFDFCGNYEGFGGLVPNFALKAACDIFANYHRDELVLLGVGGFKEE